MASIAPESLSFYPLAEKAPDMIFRYRVAPQPGFEFINEACADVMGYGADEYYADPELGFKTIHPEDRFSLQDYITHPEKYPKKLVLRHVHKNGHLVWLETFNMQIADENGQLVAIDCMSKDVTQQVQLEQRLNDALQEKDLLFRELQHRIKNTFMMIGGLFTLEIDNSNNKEAKVALNVMQARVNSMSYLYSMLRAGDATSMVSLNAYIYKLAESLISSGRIKTDLQLESIEVNSRFVMPIGLILNEMITNSIKYAFPDGRDGCVSVKLTRLDTTHILLRISDNGIGWPEGFNPEQSTGLGTQLVMMLSEQIGAEPVWNSDYGLSLELRIPLG